MNGSVLILGNSKNVRTFFFPPSGPGVMNRVLCLIIYCVLNIMHLNYFEESTHVEESTYEFLFPSSLGPISVEGCFHHLTFIPVPAKVEVEVDGLVDVKAKVGIGVCSTRC